MQHVTTSKHELYPSFICTLYYVFFLFINVFFLICSYGKPVQARVSVNFFCVRARITALVFNADGLDPYFFPSKAGKDAVYEGKNGRVGVYFPPESPFFPL